MRFAGDADPPPIREGENRSHPALPFRPIARPADRGQQVLSANAVLVRRLGEKLDDAALPAQGMENSGHARLIARSRSFMILLQSLGVTNSPV